MHTLPMRAALAVLVLSVPLAHAGQPMPEAGRWLTASGNLEVEIAPCGAAYCGTITRVLASHAMAGPGAPMPGRAAGSPLGQTILSGLQPLAGGGWQGDIVNRENGKTYHARLAALDGDRLQLTIYDSAPADGQVQVWRRPAAAAGQAQAQAEAQ